MYLWLGLRALLVLPSPKLHEQSVICPVDWSVNCTSSGALPLRGDPVKSATGDEGPTLI